MSGLQTGAGNLALWLHLRRTGGDASAQSPLLAAPEGTGPLLLVHLEPGIEDPPALLPVLLALRAARKNLRILVLGGTGTAELLPQGAVRAAAVTDHLSATLAMDALSPAALLVLGEDLPAALIATASSRGTPIILAEARLAGRVRRGFWKDSLTRSLFARIDHILAPDQPSATLARKSGGRRDAVEVTGPVTETRTPLRGNEAERMVMSQLLRQRDVWLASAPTLPETTAVLEAHQSLLNYSHRSLLILAGLPSDAIEGIVAQAEELGMAAVLRSDIDDPCADDQILIAEETDELGLWYRLSPVCFMGGTMAAGDGMPPRHPFEPAALGSAIIHGPLPGPHDAEWAQLDGAGAARRVADTEGLKKAISDLTAADQAAVLAQNAWSVSTGGAAVVRQIAAIILDSMVVEK